MRVVFATVLTATLAAFSTSALAQKAYGPGVTDTEIKIGNTTPYSGPASGYATSGRIKAAYYNMINSKGGVNGRKIKYISYDDAYSPPKTMEQTRKLVEQDEVFALFGSIGTGPNAAIQKYLNQKDVPQLFISSGAERWNDPKTFPWTVPLYPSYIMEGRIAAKYFLQTKPDGKIALLHGSDDAGKDFVKGFKEGLGDKLSQVVAEKTFELSQPTVDAEVVALKYSGADMLLLMGTPKFGAQAIRKIAELKWKPVTYLAAVTSSIKSVLAPAGLENSTGIVSALSSKVPGDPRWSEAPDMKEFLAFVKEWSPSDDPTEATVVSGYVSAWLTAKVLSECGDNLTRENLLKVVRSQKDVTLPLAQPGVTFTITPEDYSGYKSLQMVRFNGQTWEPTGSLISAD